jgi:hypothetical protein
MTSVSTVFRLALLERATPVLTAYELFRLLWDIYTRPEQFPIKFRRRVSTPGYLQFSRVIEDLATERFLRADEDFEEADFVAASTRTRVFRVSDIPDAPGEDIACLVDPFAYISHLSALHRYGLSDRQPKMLMVATPHPPLWAKLRDEKMLADYGFSSNQESRQYFQPLQHITLPTSLRRRKLEVHHLTRGYSTQAIADGFARVIEIGSLFAQTLDDPSRCGGMEHVLEIWDAHAGTFLEPIIEAVTNSPAPIIKVRAGYILAERLGLSDSRIDAWKAFAQRGGSRKLNPSEPYAPVFSEDWMLSLNVGA